MDRITRTSYTDPTPQQIEDELIDLMQRLGMYRDNDNARRDQLAQQIVDALPYRIVRRVELTWVAEAQA